MLGGTPYALEAAAELVLAKHLTELSERISLLRSVGKLNDSTLKRYYGDKRFEQIAESNAIEGSTLSVGETQLAVLKGLTITGHDPKHSDAARALAQALDAVAEMAKDPQPVGLNHVREIHRLLLAGHPQAGAFRSEEVRISGASHIPPRTGPEVMAAMTQWADWSRANESAHPLLRAAVLQAWLTHIHPFVDGNGRTARAITTLELVRAGYPPLVIKKRKHRDRYIDALGISDESGNLGPFLDLLVEREEDAIRDLESAAASGQNYDAQRERLRRRQGARLTVWNAAVELLSARVESGLKEYAEAVGGEATIRHYRDSLTLDDYLVLCDYASIRDAWAFRIELAVPAMVPVVRLAWLGFRSDQIRRILPPDSPPEPSIFWSSPNPSRYPQWIKAPAGHAPRLDELTLVGDVWFALPKGRSHCFTPTEAASEIVRGFEDLLR